MPNCGSQVILCDLPVRFDTYKGCTHGCEYCFVTKKNKELSKVSIFETDESLKRWVEGKRNRREAWANWEIPLHWGGMSDPFQPIEAEIGMSYKCLKVFAETKYPFVFSTKGELVATKKYLKVLKECNVVAQVSLVAKSYEKYEPGCPSFEKRLEMIQKLSEVCQRVIVRIQPYDIAAEEEVATVSIPKFAEAGAYGVTVEGWKYQTKHPYTEKLGGDMVFVLDRLKPSLLRIKKSAHDHGMHFYSAENRLRFLGDNVCCCGAAGVKGFEVNKANLNHYIKGDYEERDGQTAEGTSDVFQTIDQTASTSKMLTENKVSFAEMMRNVCKTKGMLKIMGVDCKERKRPTLV